MITSSSNAQVKAVASLMKKAKERRQQGLFVAEGAKMVQEAPAEWITKVYYSEGFCEDNGHRKLLANLQGSGCAMEKVSDSVYKGMSDTQTPQGIMAVLRMPDYKLADLMKNEKTLLLVLESIQDPGNLGTMIRTGEGAGVTGIVMNRTTVDLFHPKVIRSTMGSIYRMPFYLSDDLAHTVKELHASGVILYAAHLQGERVYDTFDYRCACGFFIGNEGNGLSDEIAELADCRLKIPMEGQLESLNAAVSAALLVYEAARQRRSV